MFQRVVNSCLILVLLVFMPTCLKYEPERVLSVETNLVSEVSDVSCTATGIIIDLGEKPNNQYGFCYSTEPNPTAENNEGIVNLGSTNTVGDFTTAISDLTPETKYFIRAYLSNSDGSTYGKDLSFTTSVKAKGATPTVSTATAEDILETSATLGGEVTGDGGDIVSERGIYYSTNSDPGTSGTKVSLGDGLGAFSTTISGLVSNTKYFYAAYASNSDGTSFGATLSFTTIEEATGNSPTVTTATATDILEASAIIGGEVTADGGESVTERGIYYGTSSDPFTSGTKVSLGDGLGAFSTNISGLASNTEYFFTAFATNSHETSFGAILSFTTGQPIVKPTVTTSVASQVAETSATVGGEVSNQGGAEVTERGIYYGTSSDPLTSGTQISIGSGTGAFSTNLSGLIDGTRYYYKAYATNSAGTSYGTTLSFTTTRAVVEPSVTTAPATSITETTAIVGGDVTDDGGGTVTERGVFYSTSSDPLSTGTKVAVGNGNGSFTTTLSGLIDETKYYFVAFATNSAGTSYGTTLSFTTTLTIVETSVTTVSASLVTETTATVGGNVIDDGGGTVMERGVYYGTSSDPLTAGTKVPVGSGPGSFSTTLSGLIDGTKYYFVAFATNSAGTSYGLTLSFTTLQSVVKPSVSTASASLVTETTANVGGNVTDDGGGTVTERGIYYGTSSDPFTTGTKVPVGSGPGSFSTTLTGLADGTTYYYGAYAINSAGTSYNGTLSFKTVTSNTVTDFEGNVYQTVVIGGQRWMAENLKTRRYSDGSWIPLVESTSEWDGLGSTSKAYCYYDNEVSNGNTYGALYSWPAAMNGANSSDANPSGVQGVCPSGWHLPSDDEWKQLELFLGMSQAQADNVDWRGTNEGSDLREAGTAHWISPNDGATNASGFTALPGGGRGGDGAFFNIKGTAYYWTTYMSGGTSPWTRVLYYGKSGVKRSTYNPYDGFSVRCVKD